jgi:hypothetical protein
VRSFFFALRKLAENKVFYSKIGFNWVEFFRHFSKPENRLELERAYHTATASNYSLHLEIFFEMVEEVFHTDEPAVKVGNALQELNRRFHVWDNILSNEKADRDIVGRHGVYPDLYCGLVPRLAKILADK